MVGPFIVMTSLLSVFRQMGRIEFNVEVRIAVIVSGVLRLLVRSPAVPAPRWVSHIANSGLGQSCPVHVKS